MQYILAPYVKNHRRCVTPRPMRPIGSDVESSEVEGTCHSQEARTRRNACEGQFLLLNGVVRIGRCECCKLGADGRLRTGRHRGSEDQRVSGRPEMETPMQLHVPLRGVYGVNRGRHR